MKRLYVTIVLILLIFSVSYAQDYYSFTKDEVSNLIAGEETLDNIDSGINAAELADEIFNGGANNELIKNIKDWFLVAKSSYEITSNLKRISEQAATGAIPDYYSALEAYDGDLFCDYISPLINELSLGAGDLICIGVKFYSSKDKEFINHQIKYYIDFRNQGVIDPYSDEVCDRGDGYLISSGAGSNTEVPLSSLYTPVYVKSIVEKYYNYTLHYNEVKKDNKIKYQKFCEQIKQLNDQIAGYKSGQLIDVFYSSESGIIIANNGDDNLTNIKFKKQYWLYTTDIVSIDELFARQSQSAPTLGDPNNLFSLHTSDIDFISFIVLGIPIEVNIQNCKRSFVMNMNATPTNLGITKGYAPDSVNVHYSIFCTESDRINLNISFGDGVSTEFHNMTPINIGVTGTVKHYFKKDGNYNITVTATNQASITNSVSKLLTLKKALIAPRVFSAISETTPYSTVNLNCDAVNTILEINQLQFKWDFDYNYDHFDIEKTDKNPQHIFAVSPDELNEKSIVTKNIGFVVEGTFDGILYSDTTYQPIDVRNPIYPAFQVSPTNITGTILVDMLPFEVNFDASSSKCQKNNAISYTWDFGDGTSGHGKTITHAFTSKNTFTVKLTVNDGVYSNSVTKKIIIDYDPITFRSKKLVEIEYFFDSDPGLGKATSLTISPTPYVNVNSNISLANVSTGLHRLYFRTRDEDGKWSTLYSKPVLVTNEPANASITKMEYFLDNKPETGTGASLNFTAAKDVSVSKDLDLANVAPGLHRIYFRAKDNTGRWSTIHSKPLLVTNKKLLAPIKKIEYFFDEPTAGVSASTLSFTPSTDVTVTQSINTSNVTTGLHRLYFKAQDETGRWSALHSKPVLINNSSTILPNISRLEYFIDSDPGINSGIALPFNASPDITVNSNITLDTISIGEHNIYFRAKDSNGLWSFPRSSPFSIENSSQDIALNSGWNIISSNVVPDNLNLMDIFQPLIDGGTLKKVMDETGKTIENFGSFGGWKNSIGDLNSGKGYKVSVTAASTLSLEGMPVPLPLDIALNTGWNIISYPTSTLQDAKEMVQALIDAGKLKKVMDETGRTIENFGSFGGWKNSIGNFTPGKGYKVSVTENCILNIPATMLKTAVIVPEVLASTHFTKVFSGNGTDHMNIYLVNLQNSGLLPGDEIGVFDGQYCVGSVKIGMEQLAEGSINIPASGDDGLSQTVNGFRHGNPVTLQLFREGQIYSLNMEKVGGNEWFEINASLFAKVSTSNLTVLKMTDDAVLFKCYPNPFTREITIEVQNFSQADLTVEIYNMTGQLIKNLYEGHTNGNLLLKWNGTNDFGQQVAPGVYLCKINGMVKQVIFEGGKE